MDISLARTKRLKTKVKKQEIVKAIENSEKAEKQAEQKINATNLTLSITGTTNEELLANLEKEKQRLLTMLKNKEITTGDYIKQIEKFN